MTTLRVLSYNVRGLRDDMAALTQIIAGSGAHLVFVQETPKIWRWRARCAEFARRCEMVVVVGGGTAAGNMLMSAVAVRVHSARTLFLPLTPGQQLRGAAVAHCSLGGAEFTAVSTHLSLNPAERVRQVPRLLAEVPENASPLLLAGDMNEQPDGPTWQTVTARLADAAVLAGGAQIPTFSCGSPRRRIDGIFVDARATVRAYRVLDSPEVRRASDHFPLYAEIALPDRVKRDG